MSHPSWVRGLKHDKKQKDKDIIVAPLVGAWIETVKLTCEQIRTQVAPLVGAWIETQTHQQDLQNEQVAPLVGAWIETLR